MKKKSIEDLFKDSFENFEAEVSSSVWTNIKTGLKSIGLGFFGKAIVNKIGTTTIVAVVSSVATIIGTVGVMHWTGNAVKGKETTATASVSKVTATATPVLAVEKDVAKPVTETKAEAIKSENPVSATTNDVQKSLATTTTVGPGEQKMQEANLVIQPFNKDKKKIQSVINTFSKEPIASIFPSPVGGTVPLIVNLSNTGKGTVNRWKYSDGKKDDKTANPVHVFENPGVFTVTLVSTDAEGKTQVDSVKIEVTGNSSMSAVPQELTPNGDGLNDVFPFDGKNLVKMNGEIFDSKGTIFFECDKVGAKWDGTNRKGDQAKVGMYYYSGTAEGKDGKKYEFKGKISLIR